MKLYNTLTGKKEEFKTINEGVVNMYVCGPTVYNFFHIGNARPFMMFDVLRRYFEYRGYKVNYIQNFTDVDDKIINKAKEEKVDSNVISEKYIEEYFKDADHLGIHRATHHPKVTENIDSIIGFIEVLIEKGFAYVIDNGDVYFNTHSFEGYGKLSGQSIDDLESGARVEVNLNKKNPTDFALWKSKKEGEPFWESPWGEGRPGWHIECSVMSTKFLSETIDIHAGGHDLIFPHHENEIAQSEAYSGKPFAKYWLHNGYINIDNQKMSKSKGNFFTVREILEEYDPEVVRFFMIGAHYRSPVNFSRDLVVAAANGLERMYTAKENLEFLIGKNLKSKVTEEELQKNAEMMEFRNRFIEAMDDDFNTADAVSVIFELVRFINTNVNEESSEEFMKKALELLKELTGILGILTQEKQLLDLDIEKMIEERQEARKNKNFKRSDEIRDLLIKKGIKLEDTPQGVKWSYVK
ncbi:MAG: cysteine--tRNA ligase [Clostridiales bacterium]|nr:cysteine--tRNA ligase [Clostridiales bacterium]